jgi:hypothetical protein
MLMNLLAAVLVAEVGVYTIYRGPRNWLHWLAGGSALLFALATVTNWDATPERGLMWAAAGYAVIVTHIVLNRLDDPNTISIWLLRWIIALSAGTAVGMGLLSVIYNSPAPQLLCIAVPVGLVSLMTISWKFLPSVAWREVLIFAFGVCWSAIYFVSLPVNAFLFFAFPILVGVLTVREIRSAVFVRRIAVICTALAFAFTVLESAANQFWCEPYAVKCAWIFPFTYDITVTTGPMLVGIGVTLTCIALIGPSPRQSGVIPEAIEPSGQSNPL